MPSVKLRVRHEKKKMTVFGMSKVLVKDTLPETNIAPENRPLEKEIPIGNHHFLGSIC